MKKFFFFVTILLAVLVLIGTPSAGSAAPKNPRVRLATNLGNIDLELDVAKAPLTVTNFVKYVDNGFYNGTIFHRVIPGFMIQGGGFTSGMTEKPTGPKLRNEADNGLKNVAGTIAMARTPDPHSASAQFFINTVDNPNLDHRSKTEQGWGYAVFGKVIAGMAVVKKIEAVQTATAGFHQNVPVNDVIIRKAYRLRSNQSPTKAPAAPKASAR